MRSNVSTSLSPLVSAKSSSKITFPRSSSGVRGYDHRGESTWKGASERGAGEVPMREAGKVGRVGAGAGVAAATIGAVSEGVGTQDRMDAATVGRTVGAE